MTSVRYAWNRVVVQKNHVSCPHVNMCLTAAALSHGYVKTIPALCVVYASILTISPLNQTQLTIDLQAIMVQEEEVHLACTAAR